MSARSGLAPFGTPLPPQEEAPSQALLPIADQAVLFVCRRGANLDAIFAHLLASGLRPTLVTSIRDVPTVDRLPRNVFVDWAMQGAAAYVAQLSEGNGDLGLVGIVESPTASALAFAAGAVATVTTPIVVDEVASCLQGLRARHERRRMQNAVLEHGQRVSAATAFDGMLRTLGQELRIPLATALANVEYLGEVAQSAVSPLSEDEHLAVLRDTLDAMQQLRSTLEGMSVFLPRDPAKLEPVRLWRVAQRVLDELPNGIHLVTLAGDSQVRGWCEEGALTDVLSTLVKRSIQRQGEAEGPRVTLHVYAHDTEARLTVREVAPLSRRPRTSDDPFQTMRHNPGTGQGGLRLAAARHAIVKMGGVISYVHQNESGCAFRVRLRLAQPDLLG